MIDRTAKRSTRSFLVRFLLPGSALLLTGLVGYWLGQFRAQDIIQRPATSWAMGSTAAIKLSDLSISLEHAGAEIRRLNPNAAEAELAQAYEYLSELLTASIEQSIGKGDPNAPAFTNWMSDYRKFLGDSPDAIYLTAPVESGIEYSIDIEPGSADYIGFVVYERNLITGWNSVADSHSVLGEDINGPFRMSLHSDSAKDTNGGLSLTSTSHTVMVRQYFFEHGPREPATLQITPIGSNEPRPETSSFESRAEAAVRFFNQTWQGSLALANAVKTTPNSFERPPPVSPDFVGIFYPTPDTDYHGGSFDLKEGESLVIEGAIPDAAFWSVTLQNHFMQSLEVEGKTISLSGQDITEREGEYRIWISQAKPPAGEDWLNTGGTSEGLVAIRYLLSSNASPPSARLVGAR